HELSFRGVRLLFFGPDDSFLFSPNENEDCSGCIAFLCLVCVALLFRRNRNDLPVSLLVRFCINSRHHFRLDGEKKPNKNHRGSAKSMRQMSNKLVLPVAFVIVLQTIWLLLNRNSAIFDVAGICLAALSFVFVIWSLIKPKSFALAMLLRLY